MDQKREIEEPSAGSGQGSDLGSELFPYRPFHAYVKVSSVFCGWGFCAKHLWCFCLCHISREQVLDSYSVDQEIVPLICKFVLVLIQLRSSPFSLFCSLFSLLDLLQKRDTVMEIPCQIGRS